MHINPNLAGLPIQNWGYKEEFTSEKRKLKK